MQRYPNTPIVSLPTPVNSRRVARDTSPQGGGLRARIARHGRDLISWTYRAVKENIVRKPELNLRTAERKPTRNSSLGAMYHILAADRDYVCVE
ncbi:unnamed protein product, partial [Iphiclides podalirius]